MLAENAPSAAAYNGEAKALTALGKTAEAQQALMKAKALEATN